MQVSQEIELELEAMALYIGKVTSCAMLAFSAWRCAQWQLQSLKMMLLVTIIDNR